MSRLANLNLIHFLDFYFMFMFVMGTWRRWTGYREIGRLMVAGIGRWPKLLKLVHEHRTIFLTWRTMLPGVLAFTLTVVQLFASRLLFPQVGHPPGELTPATLFTHYFALPFVVLLGLAMFGLDGWFLVRVAIIDRMLLEKYFDQAEYWLNSGTAHVVRVVTFGFVNPRKMVGEEVRKALLMVTEMLNTTLWWMCLQIGLRFTFGLSLWITWALGR